MNFKTQNIHSEWMTTVRVSKIMKLSSCMKGALTGKKNDPANAAGHLELSGLVEA
jgi:hypothetical protein